MRFPIPLRPVKIGRADECDIQLTATDVSREHCTVRKLNKHFEITDHSRNGTLLNGKKIKTSPFTLNDTVEIGGWQLRIEPANPTKQATLIKNVSDHEGRLGPMLGTSPGIEKVFELIRKVASTDTTVCLIGESGTGKELAARSVHELSVRHREPFVPVNCGAIPENLIESILFGHEKGSFTGAAQQQKGLFEEAHQGTLFLDEIGEMPLNLQTRLLRVLENKTLRRVGGKSEIPVDVRLVCATHRDLKQQVVQGTFRQDLFFRLYIFPLEIPPLRERHKDILPLANGFLKDFSPDGQIKTFSAAAQKKLQNYNWPGNVRELKNAVQRTLILSSAETIEAEEIVLTDMQQTATPSENLGTATLEEYEREAMVAVLKRHRGNQSSASEQLGISRSTLFHKIKKYSISDKDWS